MDIQHDTMPAGRMGEQADQLGAEQVAVRLCQRGDPAGLATLVAIHQARAVRLAALITHDPHLAEDVVAEAFLVAFRRCQRFDTRRPFAPWFHRVVATTALKMLAARHREVSLDGREQMFEADEPADLAQPDAAARLAALEDQAAIRAALTALPAKQRAAVVLKYFAELDEAEIAAALAIPRGTVKSRVFNGLARLRLKLAELRPT